MKILLFVKKNKITDMAIEHITGLFNDILIKYKVDKECYKWRGDYILSFINGNYIPPKILKNAKIALNWHTAPPQYPGTGGYSMALLNEDTFFGITMHVMDDKFDHGPILDICYFRIPYPITIDGLLNLAHKKALEHFINYTNRMKFRYFWQREKAYTRNDMLRVNKILQERKPEVID